MELEKIAQKPLTYQDIETRAKNILSKMHGYNTQDEDTKSELVDVIITDILQHKKIGDARFSELEEETQEKLLRSVNLTELFDGTSHIFDAHLKKLRAR